MSPGFPGVYGTCGAHLPGRGPSPPGHCPLESWSVLGFPSTSYLLTTCLPRFVMGGTGQGLCVMTCGPWGHSPSPVCDRSPQASSSAGSPSTPSQDNVGCVPHGTWFGAGNVGERGHFWAQAGGPEDVWGQGCAGSTHPHWRSNISGRVACGPVQMTPGPPFLPWPGFRPRLLPSPAARPSSTVATGTWHVVGHTQLCCESRRHAGFLRVNTKQSPFIIFYNNCC